MIKQEAEPTNSIAWTDEEIETFKVGLKNSGRNWAVISQKMNGAKTTEQCKKFFYNNRKKYQLDKLVTEFKRVIHFSFCKPRLKKSIMQSTKTRFAQNEFTSAIFLHVGRQFLLLCKNCAFYLYICRISKEIQSTKIQIRHCITYFS